MRVERWSDHRRVINGVLYRVRTGVQWRELPKLFGPRETVYERHRRWSAEGDAPVLRPGCRGRCGRRRLGRVGGLENGAGSPQGFDQYLDEPYAILGVGGSDFLLVNLSREQLGRRSRGTRGVSCSSGWAGGRSCHGRCLRTWPGARSAAMSRTRAGRGTRCRCCWASPVRRLFVDVPRHINWAWSGGSWSPCHTVRTSLSSRVPILDRNITNHGAPPVLRRLTATPQGPP
ncbi:transposase [Streptomyces sp. NPDC096311]|uniref:transposase n=1 Tax=Streptomyces sp. NPDC096311 TaxID=3366083 RepID=UPI0037F207D3